MDDKLLMAVEPGPHLWMLMYGKIIKDDVDDQLQVLLTKDQWKALKKAVKKNDFAKDMMRGRG